MNSNAQIDGDPGFRGVEMRLDPATLAQGVVSYARNCRFRRNKAETRPGIVKVKWTHHLGVTWPLVFPIFWDGTLPFVNVFGAGRFDDPAGVEWIFIAGTRHEAVGQVWVTRPNNALQEEPLPAGETIDGPVAFVQAVDKVFLFRGETQAPLVLEEAGTGKGFRALTLSEEDVAAGLSLIPNAERALFFQNRLILPHGRDLVDVSDVLDPEHVNPTTSQFRINQGSSDRLVGIYKFNDDTLICAKEESIYALSNLTPDENGELSNARLDAVTTAFGFVAGKSVVAAGSDLIGLSQLGVMSVTQTEQNKLQGMVLPLSAPIEPLIQRINWKHASGACAAYWDSKYYLAVPLDDAEKEGNQLVPAGTVYPNDGSTIKIYGLEPGRKYRVRFGANDAVVNCTETDEIVDHAVAAGNFVFTAGLQNGDAYVEFQPLDGGEGEAVTATVTEVFQGINNAVLVYDFVNQAWCGLDDGDGLTVTDFVTLFYQGRQRLFFVSADGFLNLYEEGNEDDFFDWQGYPENVPVDYDGENVGVHGREIETEIVTRGYGLLATDGSQVGQRRPMGEKRTVGLTLALATWNPRYSIFERPDGVGEEIAHVDGKTKSRTQYDQWNKAPWDPTNANDDHGTARREDYSVTFDVAGGVNLGSGLVIDAAQEALERIRVRSRAGTVQVRVLNTQGRMELKRAEVAMVDGRQRFGTLI